MESYATPEELAAWIDPDAVDPDAPPLATVLLRSATQLVLDAIVSARYPIDGNNHPTDPEQREAVRSATLEQAAAWVLHSIDPRLGVTQLTRRIKSKSLGNGSVNVTYEDADASLVDLAAADTLTDAAMRYLDNAGLISNRVWSGGAPEVFNVAQRAYDPTTGSLL